jgi:hypothetical protein
MTGKKVATPAKGLGSIGGRLHGLLTSALLAVTGLGCGAACASENHTGERDQGLTGTGGAADGSAGGRGAVSSAGAGAVSCNSEEALVYEAPGCGTSATPVCEPPPHCLELCEVPNQPKSTPRIDSRAYACDCDGHTVMTFCCLFDKPFRFWGTCTDAGDAMSGSGGHRREAGVD